jgi:hypothetical protein
VVLEGLLLSQPVNLLSLSASTGLAEADVEAALAALHAVGAMW